MSEELVVLADVESWHPLANGDVEVRGKLSTLNKAAQGSIWKVANWLRSSTRALLAQCNVNNDLGEVRIEGKTIIATVRDPRALPLVKRGCFHKFVAVVDEAMGGDVLAVSLVDRVLAAKSAGSNTSVMLFKRAPAVVDERAEFAARVAATQGINVDNPRGLLFDREAAARANAENEAWLRRQYGIKPAKLPKDKASKAEVKRVRKNFKKLGGTLGTKP